MSLYDINYDQQAIDLLPPDKRDSQTVSLTQALLRGVQWARDLILGGFKTGATAPAYAPGAYNIYDQVLFQKSVYVALVNTSNDPTNTNDWLLIQPNFIGMDERIKYNGQKIILEYALNKEFNGIFRQPATMSLSDIYITNIAAVPAGYRVGQTETGSSTGQDISSDSIGNIATFIQINNFQINIKTALFALTNEQAIRNFVNKYLPISLNYIIVTY